ncbi:MAG: hypothetical protein MRY81_17255 [Donghicola eburneus]|jgi:hypothetical protein|nr:hypothetical protein [Donghicola eburneus]MCI5041416.1 hypothetical protein [Donghicola eburneus]
MINKLTARVALVGVLCVGGAQVFALTVEEAISATTDAGYSAVAVRTSRDGRVTSVLATDGDSYYEIDYDTESGAATTTEATRGGRKGHGRDDRDDDESDDDSSSDTDDSSDDSSDDEDDETGDDHGGRDRDRDRDHDRDREGRGGGNH